MDLSNAALLIASVYGITELLKALLPGAWVKNSRIVMALVVAVSFAATFLVGATTWAHEQVIGGKPLDLLSTADKILVAVFVAGAAAFTQRGVKAVMNIGQNQTTDVQREALDAGAARLVAASMPNGGGSHDFPASMVTPSPSNATPATPSETPTP